MELFLDRFIADGNKLAGVIWEPACGTGNITKVLQGHLPPPIPPGFSSDIVYRGFGCTRTIDFLKSEIKADIIITNPPFSKINEFIRQGLKLAEKYLIFLAKIQTLETIERAEILKSSPLKYVYVHTARQATWKNGEEKAPNGKKWATTMCLAWFVWEIGYMGEPVIRFL